MMNVRPPAVAGMFYPAQAQALRLSLNDCFEQARTPGDLTRPKALVAPHAGYIYSGPVAASAYTQLESWSGAIRRVVLLGPVHRVWVPGLALAGADAFATPLGEIPVDKAAIHAIAGLPQISLSPAAHAQEHSLEVHLPFLQTVLKSFSLVPLVVGDATGVKDSLGIAIKHEPYVVSGGGMKVNRIELAAHHEHAVSPAGWTCPS